MNRLTNHINPVGEWVNTFPTGGRQQSIVDLTGEVAQSGIPEPEYPPYHRSADACYSRATGPLASCPCCLAA